jgi:hypothetical protein
MLVPMEKVAAADEHSCWSLEPFLSVAQREVMHVLNFCSTS